MALTAKGQPYGLAILDADGELTAAQLPTGVAVADAAALTATTAAGATPTDDEFNALVADVTEVHTQLNALLTALRNAGYIASS